MEGEGANRGRERSMLREKVHIFTMHANLEPVSAIHLHVHDWSFQILSIECSVYASLSLSLSLCFCAVVSGDESEEEEGEGENRAEVTLKMKQAMLEEEKQALLQNKELLDEVRTLFD